MSDAAVSPTILQMDVGAFYRRRRTEVDAAIARVLNSGWFILGGECAAFEAEFAEAFGYGGSVGVANGTDALTLALRALGIGPGDRVATVSHTAVATVAAIEMAGAVPVLVDVDDETLTMDPAELHGALATTAGIRAVVVVHLYGQPADLGALAPICREFGVRLVEDCAQAHGATIGGVYVGGHGDAAAFSFYPTKNLGAFGDGGAVAARDPAVLERVRALRQYGWVKRYVSEIAGVNSRLDELQAAILRVRLPELAADNERRRTIAASYDQGLRSEALRLPYRSEDSRHVFHQYVIRVADRDRVAARLKAVGVGVNIHYPEPVHLQAAYRGRLACGPSGLANSEAAARSVLSLPMYPELADADIERVIRALRAALQ